MPTRKIKKIHIIILAIIVVIASGELFARYYLGLGTPPLSIAHPKIEYMFKPNQDIYRFGNHIIINNYGMRTFPFHKQPAANEFRIMIFGDSVLNGGSLTDHTQLATTILQKKLAKIERKVLVGNISAGSWGPGNWLAYAKEYGFFKANVIVLLISSHDYTDNPTFQPLNKNTHPTKTPVSALIEGITRYLPRYLPQFTTNQSHHVIKKKTREQKALKGLKDLKDFLILAKNNSKYIFVFQHWDKKEIKKVLQILEINAYKKFVKH